MTDQFDTEVSVITTVETLKMFKQQIEEYVYEAHQQNAEIVEVETEFMEVLQTVFAALTDSMDVFMAMPQYQPMIALTTEAINQNE